MSTQPAKIYELVVTALSELGEEMGIAELAEPNVKTKIFGGNGSLDSMGVVHLVSELEDLLAEEFDIDIILADDRAMSRHTSPFRNVESLCKYIEAVMAEEEAA